MGLFDKSNVDNSRFTPEFNQGQVNDTTPQNTPDVTPQDGQVTQNNIDQVVDDTQNNEGTVVTNTTGYTANGVTYESVDDLIAAFEARENSYKNLQRDYTKKSQTLAMRNKQDQAPINMNLDNQLNAYRNNIYGNQILGNQPVPNYNPNVGNYYPPYGQQQAGIQVPSNMYQAQQRSRQMMQEVEQRTAMNQALVQMAADNAINELQKQDADFDEVAGTLWDLIDTDPYFSTLQFTSPDMVKQTIGIAYNMAKQKVEQAKSNIKINNARKEAYQNKQTKVVNNDTSNVAGKREANQSTPQDDVKASIVGVKPVRF